ncbi:MAG: ABC transporter ATP-binding protein C-terminal domain-containing protein, partial [Candidatus Kariarchaeaceae archaeon]
FDRIISLRDTKGIDIFLIEHNMDVIMAFSDEIYVLADGQVIAQGTPDEIQKNRQVLDAYLGESPDQA